MMLKRTPVAVAAVAVAVGAAGCGGGSKTGVSSQPGASLVRAGALAYVAIDSDAGSSQWKTVDTLVRKFPAAKDGIVANLDKALSKQGLSYKDDVKPALGPEVDVAVVAGATPQQTSWAALTKPDSDAKFKALVAKMDKSGGSKPVYRKVEDWYVLSQNDVMINAVLRDKGGKTLADDNTFNDAMAKLPSDALVKAYLNGHELARLVNAAFSRAQTTAFGGASPFDMTGLGKLKFATVALQGQSDGVLLTGASTGNAAGAGKPTSSKLLSGVPPDAIAYLGFRGGNQFGTQLNQLRANPQFGAGLKQFERVLGMPVARIAALLRNEDAFYVRPGVGFPELSLVLEAPNQQQALATLNRLMARIARLAHARLSTTSAGGASVNVLT